jgi:hypothetical protein
VGRHVEGIDALALADAGEEQRLEKFRLRIPAMDGKHRRTTGRTGGNADQPAERQIERKAFEFRRWRLAALERHRRAETVEGGLQNAVLPGKTRP